jgi:transposase
MLADQVAFVVGVDTHRDEHVLAVVASPSGAVVARRSVRATARGYAEALRFAEEHAPAVRVWAVEGAGSYGAGLTRFLSGRGESVIEAGRGPRDERRLQGKDDPLDAVRAARAVLASESLHCRAQDSDERRFACCCSLAVAQSMCAGRRSSSYAP